MTRFELQHDPLLLDCGLNLFYLLKFRPDLFEASILENLRDLLPISTSAVIEDVSSTELSVRSLNVKDEFDDSSVHDISRLFDILRLIIYDQVDLNLADIPDLEGEIECLFTCFNQSRV